MRIIESQKIPRADIVKFLTKKSFDEIELPPKVRETNKKIFGADLSVYEIFC